MKPRNLGGLVKLYSISPGTGLSGGSQSGPNSVCGFVCKIIELDYFLDYLYPGVDLLLTDETHWESMVRSFIFRTRSQEITNIHEHKIISYVASA